VNQTTFSAFAICGISVKLSSIQPPVSAMLISTRSRQSVVCASALMLCALANAQHSAPGLGVLPQSISSAPDDSWVPVMVLDDRNAGTKLLGLAQVKDITDGYPYKIGLYQLTGEAKIGNTGLSSQINFGKMTLTPVCSAGAAPRCEPLVGVLGELGRVGANTRYQLGPVQLNAEVYKGDRGYTQLLNPYLPLPASPTLTFFNGAGKQTGLNVQAELDSNFGTFAMGLVLAKTPISLTTTPFPIPTKAGQLNESSLNINWFSGAFGTQLSTRILELAGSDQLWGGLDLGLTWRTPWRGTLTFGAKNLVVSGKPPTYLDPERAADVVDQERIPYVRYQQDL